MSKLFLMNEEAQAALERGIDKMANIVKSTLGPKGRNVIIDRPFSTPMVSNDGVFIARELELEDPFENMGAVLLREVASNTNDVAGDGTTTATVLAQHIIKEGLKQIRNGVNPVLLKKGIERCVDVVVSALKESAIPIESRSSFAQVASIAANDKKIGDLIADAFSRVGKEGVINVEDSKLLVTEMEIIEGMRFDRGYISHQMVTDPERMEAVIDNPYLLITDQQLKSIEPIYPLLKELKTKGSSLLIIAEDLENRAIGELIGNRDNNIPQVVAVRAPEFGYNRKLVLEDIAYITGGQVISETVGRELGNVQLNDLGRAQRIQVNKDETTIVGGQGDGAEIAGRRAQIKRQLEHTMQEWEREKLQERLSRMTSGVAVIRVGGATAVERREKHLRIEDAINATYAAAKEGIVAGGGAALLQISSEVEGLISELYGDEKVGAQTVLYALSSPFHTIAENCGYDGTAVEQRVKGLPRGLGFNMLTGEVVNLFEDGIIDPVRVTCAAIQNAASIASLIISTSSIITDNPEELVDPTSEPSRGGGAEVLT
ncbi:60 kDa chaperonin [Marinithermofilum abyssi]|uniref:60 kDa chaperonin n=1 Tax=Marinithermofilum abyssi TaxID=1571185 RepID=A0A8J2VL23_9BACL|nr:chaperonin GroEL [Marinithermofilum abyssi]GGE29654.1 60 kDa chaperonin [Marinithermofilum abyssi]